jgi:uncharacterized DUF497 family protein
MTGPQKAALNLRKLGVSFEEAATVFSDQNGLLITDTEHSHSEERFILLGMGWTLRVLVVCHNHQISVDVIRVISARLATRSERAQYEGR